MFSKRINIKLSNENHRAIREAFDNANKKREEEGKKPLTLSQFINQMVEDAKNNQRTNLIPR